MPQRGSHLLDVTQPLSDRAGFDPDLSNFPHCVTTIFHPVLPTKAESKPGPPRSRREVLSF